MFVWRQVIFKLQASFAKTFAESSCWKYSKENFMSTRNAPESTARGKMSTVKVQKSIYRSYLRQTGEKPIQNMTWANTFAIDRQKQARSFIFNLSKLLNKRYCMVQNKTCWKGHQFILHEGNKKPMYIWRKNYQLYKGRKALIQQLGKQFHPLEIRELTGHGDVRSIEEYSHNHI